MNGTDCLLAALDRRTPERVPTFEWFIDAAVTTALVGTADPVEAACRLDLDGINVRADYRREATGPDAFTDEWGIARRDTGDCIPCVTASPIADITRHEVYRFPDPAAPWRFATLERALARAAGHQAVILNLRDGFSDMRDLLGYEEAMMQMRLEPDHFMALLDRAVDYNLALARIAVERYGIRIIATTDDVANAQGLLISPKVYARCIAPSFRRVVQGYRALGCHVIKHCDGDVRPLLDTWMDAGISCLDPIDPGAGLDLPAIKRAQGHRICVKGNIDCVRLLQDGTPAEVDAAVTREIHEAGRDGLILSSSNSIHRGVKPANYRAMLDALRREGIARS